MDWQKRYGTDEACAAALLMRQRWPDGFVCPRCGHDRDYFIASCRVHECTQCAHHTSLTAGTLFHSTNLPLTKWFWAIYLSASDKGGISALRLAKQVDVTWLTASRMLRKIRTAMGHRDSVYRLSELIEIDDALVGGRRSGGKRGRGAEGKTPVLVAVENRGERAGFVAMQAVESLNQPAVHEFVGRRVTAGQRVRSDALSALNAIGKTQDHEPRVTPPDQAGEWLPWVHIVIGNLKAFLLGTYHGVSKKYLQEYLSEFCYRFNRRAWEDELPHRLLNACLTHAQVRLS